METPERERIEKELRERRSGLLQRIDEYESQLREAVGCTADASDVATDTETRTRLAAERDRCARQVGEVDRALAALKAGEFGYCECGEPIGAGRLRANPLARLCVECAEAKERAPGGGRR